jgi:hypothetical protein
MKHLETSTMTTHKFFTGQKYVSQAGLQKQRTLSKSAARLESPMKAGFTVFPCYTDFDPYQNANAEQVKRTKSEKTKHVPLM